MNNRVELARLAIRLNEERLAWILVGHSLRRPFSQTRLAEFIRSNEWKAPAALLAWESDCPKVAPWPISLYHWIELRQVFGVPASDQLQE
jgi:hypothetical protein